jgi:hypothetical protein
MPQTLEEKKKHLLYLKDARTFGELDAVTTAQNNKTWQSTVQHACK